MINENYGNIDALQAKYRGSGSNFNGVCNNNGSKIIGANVAFDSEGALSDINGICSTHDGEIDLAIVSINANTISDCAGLVGESSGTLGVSEVNIKASDSMNKVSGITTLGQAVGLDISIISKIKLDSPIMAGVYGIAQTMYGLVSMSSVNVNFETGSDVCGLVHDNEGVLVGNKVLINGTSGDGVYGVSAINGQYGLALANDTTVNLAQALNSAGVSGENLGTMVANNVEGSIGGGSNLAGHVLINKSKIFDATSKINFGAAGTTEALVDVSGLVVRNADAESYIVNSSYTGVINLDQAKNMSDINAIACEQGSGHLQIVFGSVADASGSPMGSYWYDSNGSIKVNSLESMKTRRFAYDLNQQLHNAASIVPENHQKLVADSAYRYWSHDASVNNGYPFPASQDFPAILSLNDVPKTGDSSLLFAGIAACGALASLVGVFFLRRRRNK